MKGVGSVLLSSILVLYCVVNDRKYLYSLHFFGGYLDVCNVVLQNHHTIVLEHRQFFFDRYIKVDVI